MVRFYGHLFAGEETEIQLWVLNNWSDSSAPEASAVKNNGGMIHIVISWRKKTWPLFPCCRDLSRNLFHGGVPDQWARMNKLQGLWVALHFPSCPIVRLTSSATKCCMWSYHGVLGKDPCHWMVIFLQFVKPQLLSRLWCRAIGCRQAEHLR